MTGNVTRNGYERNMLRRINARTVVWAAAFVCATLVYATPGSAATPVVSFGPSDADSVALLSATYWGTPAENRNGQYPDGAAYWWDHTDLTIAVRAHPKARPADVQAVHDAIALWSSVLADRLPDISLTDVTDSAAAVNADIVLHLVPHAAGWSSGGFANCTPDSCEIIMKTDWPHGHNDGTDIRDPLRNQRTALHEIGHTLGLGHASPLLQSIDIMGYGWAEPDPDVTPILSDCDIEGIRTVFGWFYNNEPPHPSPVAEVIC